ncbi:unnamed protein product [Vitrella brassicaformis CCMP3155]|uniref:Uncharacterized protein n=1 Tax=Vitrella brassicaformis (strain CCMP3155) TaxID=1169540 RepID=A0A0G4FAQ8_VITBC|nr:unnamed protein product [Vitrella brassicaformis CCMP3155]|eukprot:CEM10000.1 unnamed protein product [Vitrella brassicaformis CCMP3155]
MRRPLKGKGALSPYDEKVREAASSHVAAAMMEQQQQQQQQHPFTYIFVGRRTFYLLSLTDILRLRATCTWLRGLFRAAQLRDRLRHSLGSQAGLLVRFDDDQFGVRDLLVAVCVMEEGEWVEIGELMVVGRHIDFGDDSCLRIFHHGHNSEVRAIKDQPDFRLNLDPPLAAHHLYQQHRQQHDPPVRSRIRYRDAIGEWVSRGPTTDASVSSFAKRKILDHFYGTHQINHTQISHNRRVGGGRLDGLLTQSPHTPVAGCSTTLSWGGGVRWLVLINGSHDFVAWIVILDCGDGTVWGCVRTSEAPAAGMREGAPFKCRFAVTTRLARVALGRVASYVFDSQVEQQQQQQDDDSDDDDDDGGGGWDDLDEGSGEDSGGDGGVAEAECGD